ncbi:MAG: type Z 30S ribosomal protein S14 [Chloroflexi bacterium]|nr:type Z 30S ribosomal protein S14 [Chloroflexota bacterium]
MAKKCKIEKSKRPFKFEVQRHNRCRRCGRPRAFIPLLLTCLRGCATLRAHVM